MTDNPGKTSASKLTARRNSEDAKKRLDTAFGRFRRKPSDPVIIEAYELAKAEYEAAHDRLVSATLTKEQIADGENRIARQKRQS